MKKINIDWSTVVLIAFIGVILGAIVLPNLKSSFLRNEYNNGMLVAGFMASKCRYQKDECPEGKKTSLRIGFQTETRRNGNQFVVIVKGTAMREMFMDERFAFIASDESFKEDGRTLVIAENLTTGSRETATFREP